MRTAFATVVLLGACALVHAQPVKDPDPRYGIPARVKLYPQSAPKAALKSALERIDAGDFAYLVAHILDPKFVDEAVADRAKGYEAAIERELAQLRDFQRANPDKVAPGTFVPFDPKEFRAVAAAKARERGFKQLLRDVEEKFKEDPQTLKDMRKIARDGAFVEGEPSASAAHDTVKGRTLYFKKIGDRWFLENRQADEPTKDP